MCRNTILWNTKAFIFYLHFFFGGELTTCKQWNPVFFNLKLSIGVVLETFQIRKMPTWESSQIIRNTNVNTFCLALKYPVTEVTIRCPEVITGVIEIVMMQSKEMADILFQFYIWDMIMFYSIALYHRVRNCLS